MDLRQAREQLDCIRRDATTHAELRAGAGDATAAEAWYRIADAADDLAIAIGRQSAADTVRG